MDLDEMLSKTKQATADQRAAAQAVLDSNNAAADLAVLRKSADTVLDLAKVMALAKGNPT